MQRCRTCESRLTPTEKQCGNCGTPVPDGKAKTDYKAHARTAIKWFMFLCGGMTVLSLFMNVGPSFVTCGVMTAVLGLVRSSADEMLGSDEEH
jgi:hypothetical protein